MHKDQAIKIIFILNKAQSFHKSLDFCIFMHYIA